MAKLVDVYNATHSFSIPSIKMRLCWAASACASRAIWKSKLKGSAQRLYPHLRVTLQTADALLILEYGRKTRGS